jgi:hypothetical protein
MKNYKTPLIEIVKLEQRDVIATSFTDSPLIDADRNLNENANKNANNND